MTVMTVFTNSKNLYTNQSDYFYIPNCYPPDTAQTGQVWYDSGINQLVVYNGSNWQELNHNIEVSLTYSADELLSKLVDNKKEMENIEQLAIKHSLVAEALKQLDMAIKLCKNLDE